MGNVMVRVRVSEVESRMVMMMKGVVLAGCWLCVSVILGWDEDRSLAK